MKSFFLVKVATRPVSQNCPMDNKILFLSLGKMWLQQDTMGNGFNGSSAVQVNVIFILSGMVSLMVLIPAGSTSLQYRALHRKWLVAPESAMARLMCTLLQCMLLIDLLLSLYLTHTHCYFVMCCGKSGWWYLLASLWRLAYLGGQIFLICTHNSGGCCWSHRTSSSVWLDLFLDWRILGPSLVAPSCLLVLQWGWLLSYRVSYLSLWV